MKTKQQVFEEMSAAFGPLTAELICRATAGERHEARVAATLEAAKAWASAWADVPVCLAGILSLEIGGVGGCFDASGDGTIRHPAFSALGKGRKQAYDGQAYMAAAQEALSRITAGHGQVEVALNHHGRVVVKFAGEEEEALFFACGSARWVRAEATRAALHAAGIENWSPVMNWAPAAIEVALNECLQDEKDYQLHCWQQSAQKHAPAEWEAYQNASNDDAELAALNDKMVSLGFGYMPEPGNWPN